MLAASEARSGVNGSLSSMVTVLASVATMLLIEPIWNAHQEPKAKTVTIASGGSAHSILTWVEVGNFTASDCKPTTASLLKVFPPNRKSAAFSFFSLQGCRATKPLFTYLYVTTVQPGVGHAV